PRSSALRMANTRWSPEYKWPIGRELPPRQNRPGPQSHCPKALERYRDVTSIDECASATVRRVYPCSLPCSGPSIISAWLRRVREHQRGFAYCFLINCCSRALLSLVATPALRSATSLMFSCTEVPNTCAISEGFKP